MPRLPTLCTFAWSHAKLLSAVEREGLSVEDFRRRLMPFGVSATPSRARAWLNGQRIPHVATAAAIAKVLNCRIEDFLEERA